MKLIYSLLLALLVTDTHAQEIKESRVTVTPETATITLEARNLTPGQRYSIVIPIVDENGDTFKSGPIKFETPGSIISDFSIDSVKVESVSARTATIFWELSDYATGQVEYGETEELGSFSTLEDSTEYNAHRQVVSNLKPGTKYFFRVISVDGSGNKDVSEIDSFTTAQAKVTDPKEGGEKTLGSGDQMMGGDFYGLFKAGLVTGNSPIANHHAIRIRATKTGYLTAVSYQNRALDPTSIAQRCKLKGANSVWCKCQNAKLSPGKCAFTLGNSYAVGNGGKYDIQIRSNGSNNQPSSQILGRIAKPHEPAKAELNGYVRLPLKDPVFVETGDIFHMVFWHTNPVTGVCAGLRGVSVANAKYCPDDNGAISLNGTWWHDRPADEKHYWGPFLGRLGHATFYHSGGRWIEDRDNMAWYEVQYDDGTWVGDAIAGYDNLNYDNYPRQGVMQRGTRQVDGNERLRQVFRYSQADMSVDGLWINFGHDHTRSVNRQPMLMQVKDSSGRELARATYQYAKVVHDLQRKGQRNGNRAQWTARVWKYMDLSKVVDLKEGELYTVEFSAPAGAGFVFSSYFDTHGPNRDNWDNAYAQRSTNGGKSFGEWAPDNYLPHRDMPIMFTRVGGPRYLP